MSGYFDRRSELFQQVFRDALSYPEYLAIGNGRERAAWARAEAALPQDASVRLDPAGRIVNVLCLSGIWAGTASGRSRSWHEWPGRQGRPLICASWTGTPFRNFEMSSGFWEPCGFPWWSSLPRTSMRSAATGIGRSPSIGQKRRWISGPPARFRGRRTAARWPPKPPSGWTCGDGLWSRRGRSATGRRNAHGRGLRRDLESLRRPDRVTGH